VDEPAGPRHLVLAASIRLPSGAGQTNHDDARLARITVVDEDPRHAEPGPEFAAPGADADAAAAAGVLEGGATSQATGQADGRATKAP